MTEDELRDKIADILLGVGMAVDQRPLRTIAMSILDLARAAGWSPPVPSRLRAVENYTHWDHDDSGAMAGTPATTERPLTPEEMAELLEVLLSARPTGEYALSWDVDAWKRIIEPRLVLKSGVRVVLKEE